LEKSTHTFQIKSLRKASAATVLRQRTMHYEPSFPHTEICVSTPGTKIWVNRHSLISTSF